jgi:hypothetical protein
MGEVYCQVVGHAGGARLELTMPAPQQPWEPLDVGTREFATRAEAEAFRESEEFGRWVAERKAAALRELSVPWRAAHAS